MLDGTEFTYMKIQISQDVMLHHSVTRPYMWSTAHVAVTYTVSWHISSLTSLLHLCSYGTYKIYKITFLPSHFLFPQPPNFPFKCPALLTYLLVHKMPFMPMSCKINLFSKKYYRYYRIVLWTWNMKCYLPHPQHVHRPLMYISGTQPLYLYGQCTNWKELD